MEGQDLFSNAIQKLNVNTGEVKIWRKSGYYTLEPVFIDGVVLFIAYNIATQTSSLLILDAQTMEQMAEVFLPFHLPFGLHSQFYR